VTDSLGCWLFIVVVGAAFWIFGASRSASRRSLSGDSDGGFFHRLAAPMGAGQGVRLTSDSESVVTRTKELARNVELAAQLGGPGILGTYASDGAAQQLFDSTIDLLGKVEGRGQMVIEVMTPESIGSNRDPRMSVPVRYLLRTRPVTTQIRGEVVTTPDTRVLRIEHWVWARTSKRCESCGAPNAPGLRTCEYCGAEVQDESRWVLTEVQVKARQSEEPLTG